MPVPNPIAFYIGNLPIRWYGILIACGILAAMVILFRRASYHGVMADDLLDVLLLVIPCGIVGVRLYYVLFQWKEYVDDPLQILNLRAGGLAIHGGLIAGLAAAFFMSHRKGIRFFNLLDLAAPAIALAQAIGRWGNYFNSEAHGSHTDLPWAITVMGDTVHPTFLYESLWCLMLFFILSAVDRHRRFDGQVICLYGMLYSADQIGRASCRERV